MIKTAVGIKTERQLLELERVLLMSVFIDDSDNIFINRPDMVGNSVHKLYYIHRALNKWNTNLICVELTKPIMKAGQNFLYFNLEDNSQDEEEMKFKWVPQRKLDLEPEVYLIRMHNGRLDREYIELQQTFTE